MFKTTIKTLSLFRKISNYSYSRIAFRIKEQPKLYNDALNMFMLSAFVNESVKNTNNQQPTQGENDKNHSRDIELKVICEITGCEKNINSKDCNCKDKCIVKKSETSLIYDKCECL
jgi:hypothetical protein